MKRKKIKRAYTKNTDETTWCKYKNNKQHKKGRQIISRRHFINEGKDPLELRYDRKENLWNQISWCIKGKGWQNRMRQGSKRSVQLRKKGMGRLEIV